MRLYLIRHGQTLANVGGLLDTARPGTELTDLGRLQAQALTPALGSDGISAIHVSTLRRTQATAAPLTSALGLVPQVHDGLREISAGQMEMLGDEGSVRRYLETAGSWLQGELNVRMPGGESGDEVFERFDASVDEIAAQGIETVAVVSHGAVIRVWSAVRSTGLPLERAARAPLPNTGGVVLEGEPGDWRLVSWHDEPFGAAYLAHHELAPLDDPARAASFGDGANALRESEVDEDESPAAEPIPPA